MYIFRSQPIIKLSNKKTQNLFEKVKNISKINCVSNILQNPNVQMSTASFNDHT